MGRTPSRWRGRSASGFPPIRPASGAGTSSVRLDVIRTRPIPDLAAAAPDTGRLRRAHPDRAGAAEPGPSVDVRSLSGGSPAAPSRSHVGVADARRTRTPPPSRSRPTTSTSAAGQLGPRGGARRRRPRGAARSRRGASEAPASRRRRTIEQAEPGGGRLHDPHAVAGLDVVVEVEAAPARRRTPLRSRSTSATAAAPAPGACPCGRLLVRRRRLGRVRLAGGPGRTGGLRAAR